MSENDEPGTRRSAAYWLSLCCLISILYVLSVGPVCWCWHRADYDQRVEAAIVVFYRPLIWLQERFEWFNEWLDWYADLL